MAKNKLDPMKDIPQLRRQITKPFMREYIEKVAPQDKLWFAKLCKENRKEVTNNLQGGTRKDIDLGKVREAFIERYYKDVEALHEKKKKKKEESFDEWLERIEKEG